MYLSSNLKSSLIDSAAQEKELTAKKLAGKFSLRSFITNDMRNYASTKHFVVDRSCADEQFDDFIVAFQSDLKPRARLVLNCLVLHCNNEGERSLVALSLRRL